MDSSHAQMVRLIWNIANDVLRDVFVRGQYRDVILDALLEPTKDTVEEEYNYQTKGGVKDKDGLKEAVGQNFYNTSKWTLSRQKSQATGYKEVLLYNNAKRLTDRDRLLAIIELVTNDLFQHGTVAHELSPILDRWVERFENEIEWDENGKPDFKIKCKQFGKVYSRVTAILAFENAKWEKLYWFLHQLVPLLKVTVPNDDLSGLMESVDMNTYALRRTATNQKIELEAAATILDPNSPNMADAGSDDPTRSQLDTIIDD